MFSTNGYKYERMSFHPPRQGKHQYVNTWCLPYFFREKWSKYYQHLYGRKLAETRRNLPARSLLVDLHIYNRPKC